MNDFIIYPAIDLRAGQVVRLKQGLATQQTIYGDAPGHTAEHWISQGADWLHVVNLDGAFGENTDQNEVAFAAIIDSVGGKAKVQLGGGIRTFAQIEQALSIGVTRVVLGTAVIEQPEFGTEVLAKFGGDRIAFAFDALGDELMTRGWLTNSGVTMPALAQTLGDAGAQTLIYTNIQQDGMQTGVDWQYAQRLAEKTGLDVVASGGVAKLAEITEVYAAGLSGVIVGRALYEKNFTLKEALNVG